MQGEPSIPFRRLTLVVVAAGFGALMAMWPPLQKALGGQQMGMRRALWILGGVVVAVLLWSWTASVEPVIGHVTGPDDGDSGVVNDALDGRFK